MITFHNARVGLREKNTGRLIAVYPHKISGTRDDVKEEVFDWFYTTGCSAEETMRNCIVDELSEKEMKEQQ